MRSDIVNYVPGMALAAVAGTVSALPFFVAGGDALPGKPVFATLNDVSTVALDTATVLIEFDPSRLDYVSSSLGSLFPNGTIGTENLADEAIGRVMLGISSNGNPLTGITGSLLQVNFEILANAPSGLTAVTFRCVPIDPQLAVNVVTDQNSANTLCALNSTDYAIPATAGNINVLAPTAPVPVAGTLSLTLLGLGLIVGLRGRMLRRPRHALRA